MSEDQRTLELRARLDNLAEEYADVLGAEDGGMPVCVAVTFLTAWTDPTDPDNDVWVSRKDSALTSSMAGIGLITFSAARAVE